ncbi:MAG: DUF1553 domain-containing protein, partial [Planctomycetaceae bacterium]|nr:DUF1553 domain-containing protein [Planctomycetaceae bacterium]
RLRQLASLLTHRDNGRFTRTIVNRLWHRLMGRGIVHPTDAMQGQPWNEDLLDYLAEDLAEHNYDLKRTLELITTSAAYQSVAEVVVDETGVGEYVYSGPRSKRLTAEQFMDCVWQVTGTAPATIDAPVTRGERDREQAGNASLEGRWIWSRANAMDAAAGEAVTFRTEWELAATPTSAVAIVTCDNSFTLYVNGSRVAAGDNWESPQLVALSQLRQGQNRITIVGKNGGNGPNPAGLFFQAIAHFDETPPTTLASNATWFWTPSLPTDQGELPETAAELQPAAEVDGSAVWSGRLAGQIASMLAQGESAAGKMVRASLVKSDFLMRSLGRPNRDQIVSVRPLELTTLEAIDLSNGEELAALLRGGAERLMSEKWKSPSEFIEWLYQFALCRPPTPAERAVLVEAIGSELTPAAAEDVLWAVMMLPEFQLVR